MIDPDQAALALACSAVVGLSLLGMALPQLGHALGVRLREALERRRARRDLGGRRRGSPPPR